MKPLLDDGEQNPEAMIATRRDTADRIRAANGDRAGIAAAVEAFLDFGDAGDYSPFELWDHFSMSAPTVSELAGCDAAAADRVVRIFSTCTQARYGGGQPLPADWPWRERQEQGAAATARPTPRLASRPLLWVAGLGGLLLLVVASVIAIFQEPFHSWLFPPPPRLEVQSWHTTEHISTGPFRFAPKGEGRTILVVEVRFSPSLTATRWDDGRWKARFDTSAFGLVLPDGSVLPPASHTVWPGTPSFEYTPFGDEWSQQSGVFELGVDSRLPEYFSWKLAFAVPGKGLQAGSPRIRHRNGMSAVLTPEKRVRGK